LLTELKVKDLGIIEDMDWKLDGGLNVITGETGAGKSLIIDAIELLLTGSAGEDVIRTGSSEARIEGVFLLSSDPCYAVLKNYLTEKGLPNDDDVLVISCEIRKGKTSLVRINEHTITKSVLRQIGQLLIDIHGQSQHLSLLDRKCHLDFLDAFAHTQEMRAGFAVGVFRFQEIEAKLNSLAEQEKDRLRQEDFLKFQIEEIRNAKLSPGEDVELEEERRLTSLSEKLKIYAQQVTQALDDREFGHDSSSAVVRLNQAVQSLRKLAELDSSLKPQLDVIEKSVYDLEESSRDIRSYWERIGSDPRRLEEIESRWELLKNLKRKYGRSVEEILTYLEKAETELAVISKSGEQKLQLKQERDKLKKEISILGVKLSAQRLQAAGFLKDEVVKELGDLDMGQMQFEVSVRQTVSPEGLTGEKGKTFAFTADGIDNVEFMVSTNPGEPLKPLANIASTGEVSRFTLALKGALSGADNIPVLVFDEIDIGVGGRSGDILGRKLWRLAQTHQVICVTHLPQIAAYADSHFCVTKKSTGHRTASTLAYLKGERRLAELALMLSGPSHSITALKNAGELQQKADDWKKPAARTPMKPAKPSF
jgi:DNA repair protein RecN (Recombination protein N)